MRDIFCIISVMHTCACKPNEHFNSMIKYTSMTLNEAAALNVTVVQIQQSTQKGFRE